MKARAKVPHHPRPGFTTISSRRCREFHNYGGLPYTTEAERGNTPSRAVGISGSSLSSPEPGSRDRAADAPDTDRGRRPTSSRSHRPLLTSLSAQSCRSIVSMATFGNRAARQALAAALTLLTILAASAAAWMIARTITRPIATLVGATRRIGQGRFDPIRVRSRDETALLAESINDMSAQLKKINEAKADLMHQIVHELRNPCRSFFALKPPGRAGSGPHQRQATGDARPDRIERREAHELHRSIFRSSQGRSRNDGIPARAGRSGRNRRARGRGRPRPRRPQGHCNKTHVRTGAPDGRRRRETVAGLRQPLEQRDQIHRARRIGRGGRLLFGPENLRGCERLRIGIAADELPKLFTKFYQPPMPPSAGQGTGL